MELRLDLVQKVRESQITLPPKIGGYVGSTVFPNAEAKFHQNKYLNAFGLLVKCTQTQAQLINYKSMMDFFSAEIFGGTYKINCLKYYELGGMQAIDIYSYQSLSIMDKVLAKCFDIILEWWRADLTDSYTWSDFRSRVMQLGVDPEYIDSDFETNSELARKKGRRSSSGWMTAKDFVLFFDNLDDDLRTARSIGATVSRADLASKDPMAVVSKLGVGGGDDNDHRSYSIDNDNSNQRSQRNQSNQRPTKCDKFDVRISFITRCLLEHPRGKIILTNEPPKVFVHGYTGVAGIAYYDGELGKGTKITFWGNKFLHGSNPDEAVAKEVVSWFSAMGISTRRKRKEEYYTVQIIR